MTDQLGGMGAYLWDIIQPPPPSFNTSWREDKKLERIQTDHVLLSLLGSPVLIKHVHSDLLSIRCVIVCDLSCQIIWNKEIQLAFQKRLQNASTEISESSLISQLVCTKLVTKIIPP